MHVADNDFELHEWFYCPLTVIPCPYCRRKHLTMKRHYKGRPHMRRHWQSTTIKALPRWLFLANDTDLMCYVSRFYICLIWVSDDYRQGSRMWKRRMYLMGQGDQTSLRSKRMMQRR
jgi:hypothetical protein